MEHSFVIDSHSSYLSLCPLDILLVLPGAIWLLLLLPLLLLLFFFLFCLILFKAMSGKGIMVILGNKVLLICYRPVLRPMASWWSVLDVGWEGVGALLSDLFVMAMVCKLS